MPSSAVADLQSHACYKNAPLQHSVQQQDVLPQACILLDRRQTRPQHHISRVSAQGYKKPLPGSPSRYAPWQWGIVIPAPWQQSSAGLRGSRSCWGRCQSRKLEGSWTWELRSETKTSGLTEAWSDTFAQRGAKKCNLGSWSKRTRLQNSK